MTYMHAMALSLTSWSKSAALSLNSVALNIAIECSSISAVFSPVIFQIKGGKCFERSWGSRIEGWGRERVKEIDLPAGLMTRTNLSHTNNASDITL